ncbi:hypothetical protein BDB01DRAFT_838105 [Pilobolus umbonatus]|nr:hypothetical protein BDB01DRAFT_838105 [Pilobolus umbonatus]
MMIICDGVVGGAPQRPFGRCCCDYVGWSHLRYITDYFWDQMGFSPSRWLILLIEYLMYLRTEKKPLFIIKVFFIRVFMSSFLYTYAIVFARRAISFIYSMEDDYIDNKAFQQEPSVPRFPYLVTINQVVCRFQHEEATDHQQ